MSSARGTANLLGDELAAERDAVAAAADPGEQLGLELGDRARAIAEAAGSSEDDAEVVDRLGLPASEEIEQIQAELQCDVYQAVREHRRRAGQGGRKLGSGNRRNKEFRAFILSQGGHPGVFLQRVYDRPTEQLAAELECSKRDALDRQIRCAVELQPYVEGKMPTTVHHTVRGDFALIAGAGTGLFDGMEEGEWDDVPELAFSEENQPLGESEEGGSE